MAQHKKTPFFLKIFLSYLLSINKNCGILVWKNNFIQSISFYINFYLKYSKKKSFFVWCYTIKHFHLLGNLIFHIIKESIKSWGIIPVFAKSINTHKLNSKSKSIQWNQLSLCFAYHLSQNKLTNCIPVIVIVLWFYYSTFYSTSYSSKYNNYDKNDSLL